MTEENKVPDLFESGILPTEEEMIEGVVKEIQDSMAASHIAIKILGNRVSELEKLISYLASKDPVIGPNFRVAADKLQSEQNVSDK